MNRLSKQRWVPHAAMENVISATVDYSEKYRETKYPSKASLIIAAHMAWPMGATVEQFIDWLEGQEVKHG